MFPDLVDLDDNAGAGSGAAIHATLSARVRGKWRVLEQTNSGVVEASLVQNYPSRFFGLEEYSDCNNRFPIDTRIDLTALMNFLLLIQSTTDDLTGVVNDYILFDPDWEGCTKLAFSCDVLPPGWYVQLEALGQQVTGFVKFLDDVIDPLLVNGIPLIVDAIANRANLPKWALGKLLEIALDAFQGRSIFDLQNPVFSYDFTIPSILGGGDPDTIVGVFVYFCPSSCPEGYSKKYQLPPSLSNDGNHAPCEAGCSQGVHEIGEVVIGYSVTHPFRFAIGSGQELCPDVTRLFELGIRDVVPIDSFFFRATSRPEDLSTPTSYQEGFEWVTSTNEVVFSPRTNIEGDPLIFGISPSLYLYEADSAPVRFNVAGDQVHSIPRFSVPLRRVDQWTYTVTPIYNDEIICVEDYVAPDYPTLCQNYSQTGRLTPNPPCPSGFYSFDPYANPLFISPPLDSSFDLISPFARQAATYALYLRAVTADSVAGTNLADAFSFHAVQRDDQGRQVISSRSSRNSACFRNNSILVNPIYLVSLPPVP